MANPITEAGATHEPSEYATLSMDRAITGLWTQRSPLRDADVPYLQSKFYSAGRFDSLIDGINRDMTARLTSARRAGSSRYNTNTFPAGNSFFSYKRIVGGTEKIRVLYDGADGVLYDATAGQKSTLFTKSDGAGKNRFQDINTELFFTNGTDRKKWLFPAGWAETAPVPTSSHIAQVENFGFIVGGVFKWFLTIFTTEAHPAVLPGQTIKLAGLTTETQLNGAVRLVVGVTGNQVVCQAVTGAGPSFGITADTGTITALENIVSPGTIINVGAEPGMIQMALGGMALPIIAYSSDGTYVTLYVDPVSVPSNFANLVNVNVAFDGFSAATYLNGNTFPVFDVPSATLGIFRIALVEAVVGKTVDSGNGNTGNGATGGSAPVFSTTQFAVTQDGGQQWKCYGTALQNWGLEVPTQAPTLTPVNGTRFWQPNALLGSRYSVLDENGNVQLAVLVTFGGPSTGPTYPKWKERVPTTAGGVTSKTLTIDGGISWWNLGTIGDWLALSPFIQMPITSGAGAGETSVILDSNGNLQWAETAGTSGAAEPVWNTAFNANTVDGSIVWRCLGAGNIIATAGVSYAYSLHAVDGSLSTASPTVSIRGGIFGPALFDNPQLAAITGQVPVDTQLDKVYIWRTAQGQSTLVLEDQAPLDGAVGTFTYYERGVTDTSVDGGGALTPQVAAPIAQSNNPPLFGMVSPTYHLGRIFAIVDNRVVYSGGPDTLAGNGYTAFPPLNFIPITEQPIRLFSGVTSRGPTLFVWGTSNIWAVYGDGTFSNPFTQASIYMGNVGILNYDAVTLVGSTAFAFTSKNKAVSLDPGAGYSEYGFPIGDQFNNVTTGQGVAPVGALYDPASTSVTWAEITSGDTAVYVCDGAVGWFRFSPVSSPESGFVWSTRTAIVGGTSIVQSVETSPGINQLLIAPASSGPILFRDASVNADWSSGSYRAFPSYDVKGNIVLCQSGEIAEIAHIGLKSMATGARPKVSLLLGEIAPTTAAPFEELEITSTDPPDLPPSETMYSDRYTALQNGVCPKCDNFQLKIDYGTQNFPDEQLVFSVYGAKHAERREQ